MTGRLLVPDRSAIDDEVGFAFLALEQGIVGGQILAVPCVLSFFNMKEPAYFPS